MTAIRQTARACSYASRAAFALGAASAAASRSDCSVASRSTYAFLRRRRCASVSAVVSDRPAAKSWSSGSTGARTQDQWKDIASAAMALSLSRCFSRRFGTCLGFRRPHPGDPLSKKKIQGTQRVRGRQEKQVREGSEWGAERPQLRGRDGPVSFLHYIVGRGGTA